MTSDNTSAFSRCDSSGALISNLFARAVPNLSAHDLANISKQASSLAEMISRDAGTVAEGLMMSVSDRESGQDPFQSAPHLTCLLSLFGEAFRQVAGLSFVAGEAAYLAQEKGAKL